MWDYVYLLVYIKQKKRTELNGEELYVLSNFEKGKYDWVPNKMCLEIDDKDEADFNEDLKDKLDLVKAVTQELLLGYKSMSKNLIKYLRNQYIQ